MYKLIGNRGETIRTGSYDDLENYMVDYGTLDMKIVPVGKKLKSKKGGSKMAYYKKSTSRRRKTSPARKVRLAGKKLAVIHVIVPASMSKRKKTARRKKWY